MHTIIAKTAHIYNEVLENELLYLTEDEIMVWFESNTIMYEEPSLLKVILRGLKNDNMATI